MVTPSGIALRNARVSIIDAQGVRRTTTTSSFGIFSFTNVPSGETLTFSIGSRRYRFTPRILQIVGDITLPDFVGLE
ncbi:MAG: carboxypeptidase regulatory-like domain-containing protein [Acidobacteria bacterium]|nr:carboxypeptidase regulatory-like domain-containing protein [Acidobacteriota bacterium]